MLFYYSLIGVGSSVIASEINFYYNENDINKDNVIYLMTTCNIATFLLSKITHLLIFLYIVISIIVNYLLVLNWKKSKLYIHIEDNLYTTGLLKNMIYDILLTLFQNYPFLYGVTYE